MHRPACATVGTRARLPAQCASVWLRRPCARRTCWSASALRCRSPRWTPLPNTLGTVTDAGLRTARPGQYRGSRRRSVILQLVLGRRIFRNNGWRALQRLPSCRPQHRTRLLPARIKAAWLPGQACFHAEPCAIPRLSSPPLRPGPTAAVRMRHPGRRRLRACRRRGCPQRRSWRTLVTLGFGDDIY